MGLEGVRCVQAMTINGGQVCNKNLEQECLGQIWVQGAMRLPELTLFSNHLQMLSPPLGCPCTKRRAQGSSFSPPAGPRPHLPPL